MTDNLDSPAWAEVLDFSTRTGVAKILAEVSMSAAAKVDASMNHVERGLYAVSKGLMDREDPHVIALIDSLVHQLASSGDRPRAFALGGLLLNHPIESYPRILKLVEELCALPQRWQKLIGWALYLKNSSVEPHLLQKAYTDLLDDTKSPGYLIRPQHFFLGGSPDRDLLESFVGSALARLIETVDRDRFEDLLCELRDSDFGISMRLAIKLEGLLPKKKLGDLRRTLFGDAFAKSLKSINFRGNDAGSIRFDEDMIIAPFLDNPSDLTTVQPVGDLLAMSALLTACGVWKGPAYEVRYWESAENLPYAQNAMRLAAKALSLSPEKLRQDAISVRIAMDTEDHYSRSLRVFAALPNVDPPDFDWTQIGRDEVDLRVFEAGLHQGPNWLRYLFAHLLDAILTTADERENLVMRLLKTGRGATLHLAAAFSQDLPNSQSDDLILKSLSEQVVHGSDHLFDDLTRRRVQIGPNDTILALKTGLLSNNPKAAKAAALWARDNLPQDPAPLVPLLQDAFDHWKQREDPYPKNGGAVPTSPREQLLKIIHKVEPLSPTALIAYMSDDRPDVQKVAETAFLNCLKRDETLRDQLPRHFKNGSLSEAFLHALDRSDLDLEDDTWLSLIGHLVTRGPEIRRVAVRFIAENVANPSAANDFIRQLMNDTDPDVREAAAAAFTTI